MRPTIHLFVCLLAVVMIACSSSGRSGPSASASASASATSPDTPAQMAAEGFKMWTAKGYAMAVNRFSAACNAGDVSGCAGLGMGYVWGHGGLEKDYKKGFDLIDPACTKGVLRACAVLGQIYRNAWGVETDLAKAKSLWQKACDGGEPRGCYFIGLESVSTKGPPEWHDEELGRKMLQKACDGGFKDGCDDLATLGRAAATDKLREKVKRKYSGDEPDRECTGKGLPPFRWDYEGGTYAEDEQVAKADGCTKLHQTIELQVYCCPKRPNVF